MGRFTLCRELGAGGMATVYLSKMRLAAGLDRLVAVKTIHQHLAKEQTFVDMFLDEAKIASNISHPNVCAVYDFGDVGGIYYIAMEYLVGEPLIDFVNEIATSEDETLLEAIPFLAARIIADACEGLHSAHTLRGTDGKQLQVIHRDVSPQNLFVTYEGSVKVVDFGCAKALERVTQTNTGIMKGKVSYAAPEQLNGDPLDARADVFALGVCLWETLALRQLFRRENAIRTAMAVLEEPVPRADTGNPWVHKELADIAEKALQRNPDDRYPSARALGKALRGFIARSGAPFEAAEVAEWMGHLFSARRETTLATVAEVEAIELSEVARLPKEAGATGPSAVTGHDSGRIADAPTRLAKTASNQQQTNVWNDSGDEYNDEDPVVLPTRTGRYIALFLIFVLLVGAGAYGFVMYRPQIMAQLGIEDPAALLNIDDGALGGDSHDAIEPGDEIGDPDAPGEEGAEGANADGDETGEATGDPAAPGSETGAVTTTVRPGRAARPGRPATPTPATGTGGDPEEADEGPEPVTPSATIDFSQGSVYIRTVGGGWAQVFHGDRDLGRTPLRTRLPVGRQTLRMMPNGQGPAQTVHVNIEWGAMPTVDVRLPQGAPAPTPPAGPANGDEDWRNPYGE